MFPSGNQCAERMFPRTSNKCGIDGAPMQTLSDDEINDYIDGRLDAEHAIANAPARPSATAIDAGRVIRI